MSSPDGTRIGYLDLTAGWATLDDPSYRDAFEAALAGHRGHFPEPDTAAQLAGDPEVVAPEPTGAGALDTGVEVGASEPDKPECGDLALNRPGAAASDQAIARRKAAPVRTMLGRLLGVHTEERAWRIGADGEQAVAKCLDRLGEGWHVLHAVQVGDQGSDIDHIAIGPGGVFTINASTTPAATSGWPARCSSSTASAVPTCGTVATRLGEPAVCSPRRSDGRSRSSASSPSWVPLAASRSGSNLRTGPSWRWPVARWTGGFVAGPPSSTLAR